MALKSIPSNAAMQYSSILKKPTIPYSTVFEAKKDALRLKKTCFWI